MKKVFLIIILISGYSKVNAQSNDAGKVSGSIGIGFGAAIPSIEFSNNSFISGEIPAGEILSINTFYPMELNFGIAKPISLGIQYTPTHFNYVGGITFLRVKTKSVGLNINFYVINRNRFNMALSLTPGKMIFKDLNLNFLKENLSVKLQGSSFKTRLRLNTYLSKNAGLYLDLGYDLHTIKLKEFSSSFTDQDLENDLNNLISNGISLKMRGLHVGIGIAVKF